jgi:hypothetical protein
MGSFQQINNHILLHKENKNSSWSSTVEVFFWTYVQVEVDIKD